MAQNTLRTFQATVASSGTPVQLESNGVENDQSVLVKAKSGNTGTITVGYSSATALNSGTSHFKLAANEALEVMGIDDSNDIWIDTTNSGDGVEVVIG